MCIHQALHGSEFAWTVVDSTKCDRTTSNPTVSNLQVNDLILLYGGSDSNRAGNANIPDFTTIKRGSGQSIGYFIGYRVHASGTSFTIADAIENTNIEEWDYGLMVAMRSPTPSASYTVTNKVATNSGGTNGTPTHNNASATFAVNELAMLAAWQDDDNASPMVPPAGSVFIDEDVEGARGSLGLAFFSVPVAGSYSWGSWTTTGTDRWRGEIQGFT